MGWMAGFLLTAASTAADAPQGESAAPTGSFFSSLKQAFKQDLNYEVVRGHFDVGSEPSHRFYCMVDIRTGRNEEYAVGGDTFDRPDGMTGLKANGVSPNSCIKAEAQGLLVTTGYVVKLGPKAKATSPSPATAPSPAAAAAPPVSAAPSVAMAAAAPPHAAAEVRTAGSPERIEVAGLRLGMSPDQVRAVLKPKLLANTLESSEALVAGGGRYINLIAAWTAAPGDEESYQVLFTPIPGKERAMVIVHSATFASAGGGGAGALATGLHAKYGGYSSPGDVPDAPTWRLQSSGTMLTGDACSRRALYGGMHAVDASASARRNPALTTTLDEFRYQIEQCGVAIVTADHVEDASHPEHVVTRFTVSAYSPSIGLDGATNATLLIQAAAGSSKPAAGPRAGTPSL